MKASSYSFLLFLLCFSFTFHVITASNLIHDTCKKCAQNDPNINYGFCVTSIQADPDSRCADLRKLGKISIKLIRHNVTSTRTYVKELLKSKKIDPYERACLHDCFDLYSDTIPTLKQALQDYKSKHYEDANIGVSSVLDACVTCEEGFKGREGVVSPLAKRNNDTFQLSAISLSIINMLL